MKAAVVGCGAMGSIYAALLASSGNVVCAVDHNTRHVAAINEHGLRVSGASGDRVVDMVAYTEPPEMLVDLVVIAVKAAHVADMVGPERLLVGVAQGFGASLPADGHAHHNDMKAIRMGAYSGTAIEPAQHIASIWSSAGFDAVAVADIASMQWGKLICNVAFSAQCALTGMTLGEVVDHPEMGSTSRAAALEAWEVAQALNVALDFDDPVQQVRDFADRMPLAKPSVLLDIEAGRTSEVGVINGAVPREAKKVGMTAPVNATLTGLVQALERASRAPEVRLR